MFVEMAPCAGVAPICDVYSTKPIVASRLSPRWKYMEVHGSTIRRKVSGNGLNAYQERQFGAALTVCQIGSYSVHNEGSDIG